MRKLKDEESLNFEGETEDVTRLDRYDKERSRPIRVTLRSQAVTEEILERTFRLKQDEKFKDVYIKKSLNEEEREKLRELHQEEGGKKNDVRAEDDKRKFFWKVKNFKVIKWYTRGTY